MWQSPQHISIHILDRSSFYIYKNLTFDSNQPPELMLISQPNKFTYSFTMAFFSGQMVTIVKQSQKHAQSDIIIL